MSPKTNNIPINKDQRKSTSQEAEIDQLAQVADFQDYLFCSRLVHGMQSRQHQTQDASLRYENQALIEHIIHTRQGSPPNDRPIHSFRRGDRMAPSKSQTTSTIPVEGGDDSWSSTEQEEDMIFDLEI